MLPGELKPILTALALPPVSLLLLAVLGLVLAACRRVRTGVSLAGVAIVALWLLACHPVAVWLNGALLPPVHAAKPEQLASVQAIVVLGGGTLPYSPEYGSGQPAATTLGRIRYGAWLSRRTGKPLAFAGGVGWSAVAMNMPPEAEVAARAAQDFGVVLRWSDARSRDTAENAREMKRLLAADGVTRIALVTDAWHMPRSALEFARAGFTVVQAPTGFPAPQVRPLLAWLPSPDGLALSRAVIREALGLALVRFAGARG
jgi:uncharacterized SAM-binding protein YcdF (DUF218 family)